ncbi:MAG: hypothetical protein CSA21_00830 [Deltaproteobacteria bacterium]|nr:MAG: hypothetical protein CSA21_00830 [Deltaproteobacteria bacterium]
MRTSISFLFISFFFISGNFTNTQASTIYTYDEFNRLEHVYYDSGVAISYDYDVTGNIIAINQGVTGPPDAPVITEIIAGSGSVTVYFSPPGNNGGAAIALYTVTCTTPEQPAQTITGDSSPLAITGLINDVPYECTVTATNEAGFTSNASAAVVVTPQKNGLFFPVKTPDGTIIIVTPLGL